MPSIQDRRVGRLVARKMVHKDGKAAWECQCDCGNTVIVVSSNLSGNHTRSCGCLHSEYLNELCGTHRMTGSPTYFSWTGMRKRCLDESHPKYHRYGGRGIEVCERWESFENFFADMGEKPSKRHTVDRIDNDGDYCPENCRWATDIEQANNRSDNVLLTLGDKTQTMAQWSRELGMKSSVLQWRISAGWPTHKALTQAVRRRP